MAQAAVAQGLDSLAGAGAHQAALAKLEALEEELDAALDRRKSNGVLRRAIKVWRRGEIARAGQLALQATEVDPTNAQAFHVLALALEKMGHQHKALVTFEKAFQLDPNDPDLLLNLGLTAWNMQMREQAQTMFRQFIAANPASPLGYNNLGMVQCELGDPATAIETLRNAIYRMPTESMLWNSLATVLAESSRADESLQFYHEAVRLDPQSSRPYHNLGYAYSHLGMLEDALAAYDGALERVTDPGERVEGLHSRSICLVGMGRLEEGWREYEIRRDPYFRAYVNQMVKAPYWKGENLDGKRVLVIGEQGLGDEFMFANAIPDLIRAVGANGRVQIAVDPRLVSLFQRSFPSAEVGSYDDRKLINRDGDKELRFIPWAIARGEPDYQVLMGSLLQYFRNRLTDFPKQAFLVPDAARVASCKRQLEALGGGPFVGICWRSMMMTGKRGKYYSALDEWGPILKTPGVTFINVQYGDCAGELARAEEIHGVKIHSLEGLDLKQDIEGAAALSAGLDLVISAPTAAAAAAGSVGTETWFLTAGRTWPQLGTEEFPWYRATKVLSPQKFGDWTSLMPNVAQRLVDFAKT
ncbi:MAG: tetratricopeptide repeat protein [Proteobacteria bacterium]|nr:tetratricopeptide repeat protein [Pseudomonadota bacterium]